MSFRLHCDYCRNPAARDTREHNEPVCAECAGTLDKVYVCDACGENDAACGADQCLSCIVASVIADPRELETIYGELLQQVTAELARRAAPARPVNLRVRQAG